MLGGGRLREKPVWGQPLSLQLCPASAAFPELHRRGHQQWVGSPLGNWGGRCCVHTGVLGALCFWVKLFPAEPTAHLWGGHRTPSWQQQGTHAQEQKVPARPRTLGPSACSSQGLRPLQL